MALVLAAVLSSLIFLFLYNHSLPLDYSDVRERRWLGGADLYPDIGSADIDTTVVVAKLAVTRTTIILLSSS
jgi:hypothetical protein